MRLAGKRRIPLRWLSAGLLAPVVLSSTPFISPGPAEAASRLASAPSVPSGVAVKAGYLWTDRPSAASYTPNIRYQYNSAGRVNTISRLSVGTYDVHFPG